MKRETKQQQTQELERTTLCLKTSKFLISAIWTEIVISGKHSISFLSCDQNIENYGLGLSIIEFFENKGMLATKQCIFIWKYDFWQVTQSLTCIDWKGKWITNYVRSILLSNNMSLSESGCPFGLFVPWLLQNG